MEEHIGGTSPGGVGEIQAPHTQQDLNTKFCKHCGEKIDKDCVVCPKCGKQVEELKADVAQPQVVINNSNSSNNVNTNNNRVGGYGQDYPYKSKIAAIIICLFLGGFGIHRFYVGKVGTGIIWLFTAGCFGIGWLVDFIMILVGAFRDKAGMPLK